MASNFRIGVAARNASLNAIGALLDGGTIEIRTGSPEAHPATADSGTLLAVCTFGTPAFAAAANSSMAANAIASDLSNNASGDAGHFRMKTTGGAVIIQGTVGETADATDLTLDNKTLVIAGTCAISGYTLAEAEQ